jgi:hypothetical protein
MSIMSHINLINKAKAIRTTQAFIKVKAPNAYYEEQSKL